MSYNLRLTFDLWSICSGSLPPPMLFLVSLSSLQSWSLLFLFFYFFCFPLIHHLSFQRLWSALFMYTISKLIPTCFFLNVGLLGHICTGVQFHRKAKFSQSVQTQAHFVCIHFRGVFCPQFLFLFCLALLIPTGICPNPKGNFYSSVVLCIFLIII